MGWNLFGGLMPPTASAAEEKECRHSGDSGTEEEFEILEREEIKERCHSEDSGNESQEDSEALGNENQEILNISHAKDLSLENAMLANFPDDCDRLFIVESKDEDSYDIIPKNLTFAKTVNIFNQAVREDNCEELDKIVQNIEEYEGRSITLDTVNLKSFCMQQLNLNLQNNQHIYSNILSRYKFDKENFECHYSVKELVLLAIAANDKLAEKYRDILFAEGNLSLLPLLVGSQKYIEVFIEKFHGIDGVYDKVKDQTIQFDELNKIGFFSVIALRKEQELLETVLVEYVLKDFEHVLKTSDPDPLYGVLETASLVKNEKFITIVLNAFERYINEPTKDVKDLLKRSFVTLLETAISQEHLPTIKYLCRRYINKKGYDIYEQAFADDRVIKVLNQQILKNIETRCRKEIYNLILKTALDAGNITFIEHLCKRHPECSNDVIDYLKQKSKNQEFDEVYESTLIALSNIENKDVIIDVIAHTKIYQNVSHSEQVTRQVIRNILKNAIYYSMNQEDYSSVKKVCYLCTEENAINVIFQEECEIFKSSIEKRIEDLEKQKKLLQSEALHEYNYNYLPNIMNGLAQVSHAGYDIYTKDQELTECQKDPILNRLMRIRNILQFSIDVREYSYHERQGLWDQMYSTPGTFMVRKKSDSIANRSAISVIKSDVLSENSESKSTDSQQPQRSIVDKGENIMNNEKASIEEAMDNNYRRGKMPGNEKIIGEKLSNAVDRINLTGLIHLLKKLEVSTYEPTVQKLLDQANDKITSLEEGEQKETLSQMIVLLKKELEHIAAEPLVDNDVEATASIQEVPVVERKESEPDSLLPSSEDDDFSKLEGDKSDDSAGTSSDSDSDSPFEEINKESHETRIPIIETVEPKATVSASEMPSVEIEGAESNNEQFDNLNDEKDNPAVSNSVNQDRSAQSPVHDSQRGTTHDEDFTVPSPSSNFASENLNTVISIDNNREEQSAECVEEMSNENTQPKPTLPTINKQSSESNQKTTALNTKKYVVAASVLAIAGIALGVAVAVYLEMLAVGVAVAAACCLIAATITYCYRPKSSLEDNEVEKFDKSTSYCG